ncbi:MAG: ParA family protein [Sarcina sp.]
MKIISIFNQKGGIGKTTLALNLATYLARNKKILFVDNDGQCNSSIVLSDNNLDELLNISRATTVEQLFLSKTGVEKMILKSKFNNVDFIASSRKHSKTDWDYQNKRSDTLLTRFYALNDKYDYVIFDNPPALSKSVLDVLAISDVILSPIEPCLFSVDGLFELISEVATLNTDKKHPIKFFCFLSKVDNRKNKKNLELAADLKEMIGHSFIDLKLSMYSDYQNCLSDCETVITKNVKTKAYNELESLFCEFERMI